MHLFDLQIPFFLPLWRRVVLVLFCLGWGSFEFATGAPFWGIVFGGLGVFAAWQFFFSGWPGVTDTGQAALNTRDSGEQSGE